MQGFLYPAIPKYGTKTNFKSYESAGKGMDKVAVLADSRKGNTLRVAAAIAEELGVSVGDVKKPVPDAEILFLGSGVYGKNPGFWMTRLLNSGTFSGRNIALFATAGSRDGETMLAEMANILEKKGAKILGNTALRGWTTIVRYRHPHPEDLESARKWAREIVGKG